MIKKIVLIVLYITLLENISLKANTYKIDISITNLRDSTKVYLCDLTNGSYVIIDSNLLINQSLVFKGDLDYPIKLFAIRTSNIKNRVRFWIDENPVRVLIENGVFKDAKVWGAETQNDMISQISENKNTISDICKYLFNNPKKFYSSYLLSIYMMKINKDTIQILFNQFTDIQKNSYYGNKIKEYLNFTKTLEINNQFIDITLPDVYGKPLSLSSLKGKHVLLSFWGSWCAPCREKNPKLAELFDTYKNKGFQVFAIGVETSKNIWLKAIEEDKISKFINVSDLLGVASTAVLTYNISSFPSNLLLNNEGKIVAKNITIDQLKTYLKKL